MEKDGRNERQRRRAERLRREAGNCLGIAVGTRDERTAAVMIDEAERLVGRAAVLAECSGNGNRSWRPSVGCDDRHY